MKRLLLVSIDAVFSLFMLYNFVYFLLGYYLIAATRNVSAVYKNRLDECEPLTVEFIASLVTKKARQLLDPGTRPLNKELRFDLYTRQNHNERQVLRAGKQKQLINSYFNPAWPVRFSIHGWNGQSVTCSNAAIKDAYLAQGDFNVILVDWSDYALDINFLLVVAQMFEIADKFNEFTKFLHQETGVAFEEMYLIAHSLGGHIAGIAGKRLHPQRYGVIYALDTSGPVVNKLPDEWRLAPNDALYVESIQTDISFFGARSGNLAHASFFPNWGLGQPHCPNVTALEPDFVCDHFGSLYYFVESLYNNKAFGAYRCKDFRSIELQKCGCGHRNCAAEVFMGGEPAKPKRGIYYLSTRAVKPFGYGVTCYIRRAMYPTATRLF